LAHGSSAEGLNEGSIYPGNTNFNIVNQEGEIDEAKFCQCRPHAGCQGSGDVFFHGSDKGNAPAVVFVSFVQGQG
jgi:hypothetical protein